MELKISGLQHLSGLKWIGREVVAVQHWSWHYAKLVPVGTAATK